MERITQRLEFEWDEETQRVMVLCEPLGVATSGKDIAEAFEMIGDACAVYWRTLEDLGEEAGDIEAIRNNAFSY